MKKNMLILLLGIAFCTIQCKKDSKEVPNVYPYKGVITRNDCVGRINVLIGQKQIATILNLKDSLALDFYSTMGDSLQLPGYGSIRLKQNDTFFFDVRKVEQGYPICLAREIIVDYRQGFVTAVKTSK